MINKNRFKKVITPLIKEIINDSEYIRNEAILIGYNPLEKIRGALFHWVAVPFNGVDIFCQLRCPNQTQIEQCGNISNIVEDKLKDENNVKKLDYDEIIEIRNYQENLCKLVFNIPTFDNIASLMSSDFVISEKRKQLTAIETRYAENKNDMTESERKIIETQIKTLDLQLGFILPDDTMAFVTKWAMGNDVSDIKKINRETFLRAAILAQINHKAPTDYISGVFTDYNKSEIDSYALSVYNDYQKDKQIEKESKFNWLFKGHKRIQGTSILPKRKS